MKKETAKNKKVQKEENRWINVHDDKVMNEMGLIRYLAQVSRDPSVWSKTSYEKRILKTVKQSTRKEDMHFYNVPAKRSIVRAKLIVQLKRNKVFPKTTYSFICGNEEVSNILNNFKILNRKTQQPESIVLKYSYNGRACC